MNLFYYKGIKNGQMNYGSITRGTDLFGLFILEVVGLRYFNIFGKKQDCDSVYIGKYVSY